MFNELYRIIRTGQVPIQNEIGRRRWKWFGHTLRKGKNSITRQALQWNPQGSRGRGRPRETCRRCMEREMKDIDMTWVALSKKAQDRDVWRRSVCGLYPDRGERQWWWWWWLVLKVSQILRVFMTKHDICHFLKSREKGQKLLIFFTLYLWFLEPLITYIVINFSSVVKQKFLVLLFLLGIIEINYFNLCSKNIQK